MLTAQIIDDFTDTPSNKARAMRGQGIANFFTGLLGAMGGCAMIGQSVINVKSGGKTRLSTLISGVLLLFLLVVLHQLVANITMPSPVAVLSLVSNGNTSLRPLTDVTHHLWTTTL